MNENVLFYTREAEKFEEALPIGNGKLGAMIYGKSGREKISLNLDTLWSGNDKSAGANMPDGDEAYDAYIFARDAMLRGDDPEEAERRLEKDFYRGWTEAYLPLGDLFIDLPDGDGKEYRRELDMRNALASVLCGGVTRKHFVSFPDKCFVSLIESKQPSDFGIGFESQLKYTAKADGDAIVIFGVCPTHVDPNYDITASPVVYGDGGISYAVNIKVRSDGKITVCGDRLRVSGAKHVEIILAGETSFGTDDPSASVGKIISDLSSKSAEAILCDHVKDFAPLYDRVSLDLRSERKDDFPTDERLKKHEDIAGLCELLFNFGRYLTLSASREGSEATNLQGIWNETLISPWSSNYTVNINTEMNYWPTLLCDLPDCAKPLHSLIERIRKSGRETAKRFYHAPGFVCHHNTDLRGHTTPVGNHRKGSTEYAFFNMASGWLCRHLFEYYEYTNDSAFLREVAYPTMKEAAEFYENLLVPDSDGSLILCPAASPENQYYLGEKKYALAKYCAMSQTIVAELFGNCIRACEILSIDAEFSDRLREKLSKLRGLGIGCDGRLLEWDREYRELDVHHRHLSHLYALFPSDLINENTPGLLEAAKKSLYARGIEGQGWSMGWKLNLMAKICDRGGVYEMIKAQLKYAEPGDKTVRGGTLPNLFDNHPPFQIDGNFGFSAGICNMLLQSNSDGNCVKIKLLHALPDEFSSGSVRGLIAKRNIKIDVEWENGRAVSAVLLARSGDVSARIEANGMTYRLSLKANEYHEIKF